MQQIVGMIFDLGLGVIAIKLTLSLEKNLKSMGALLAELTKRVEKLETQEPQIRYLIRLEGDGN